VVRGDVDWPIHSTAYRRVVGSRYRVLDSHKENVELYEKRLLEQAKHKGFGLHEGRELSDLELLARLRHHGAATSFVDATRSALIGLWFCVSDRPDKVGLLLGIHCDHLGGKGEGYLEKRPYDEVFKRLPETHPQTWDPSQVSARVAAQHSQLLYSPIVDRKTGSLALPKKPGAILFTAIAPDLKIVCEKLLSEVYDIRRETLFPDLDGFGLANSVVRCRQQRLSLVVLGRW
jgi:hypothetical protein